MFLMNHYIWIFNILLYIFGGATLLLIIIEIYEIVKEETNLDIKLHEEYRYEIHYSPKEGVDKTVVFFLAENMSNEVKKQDCEIANIGWFNYKEAKEILTYDIARELLEKSYNDLKKYKQK